MAVYKGLSMHHMDMVTTYESLDSDIYMKVPEELIIPNKNHNCNIYCVKLKKSLYGLNGRKEYGTTD